MIDEWLRWGIRVEWMEGQGGWRLGEVRGGECNPRWGPSFDSNLGNYAEVVDRGHGVNGMIRVEYPLVSTSPYGRKVLRAEPS